MKTILKIFLALCLAVFVFSCSRSNEKKQFAQEEKENAAVGNANTNISSSAAVETGKDTSRKFIRTAEMKFKVRDVMTSTYVVEDITRNFGGFVTFTELNSNQDYKNYIPVSADSSLESIHFTVVNTMTLRVPNIYLDTTLKAIAAQVQYLDYRIIKADDVALQLLSNKLTQQRVAKSGKRLEDAIENRGKKLKETSTAEETLLGKQEQADQAKIANMSLQDQVNFSTVKLSIYQRSAVVREVVSMEKDPEAWQPSFGSRLLDAFRSGWYVFEDFLIVLAHGWWLIVGTILIYVIYRRFGKDRKKD